MLQTSMREQTVLQNQPVRDGYRGLADEWFRLDSLDAAWLPPIYAL